MREIKFRFWNKEKQIMTIGLDLESISKSESDAEKYIPMQFTGLKDKNGKEIYEGDIVKNKDNGAFGEVFYNEKRWSFQYHNGWGHPIEGLPVPNESEIIGNIYENPDLLTHKAD